MDNIIFVLLLTIIPASLAVDCYECFYEEAAGGDYKKGDRDCRDNPESVNTVSCPTEFCGKIYSYGKVEDTDFKGYYRGCENPADGDYCTTEIQFVVDSEEYPELKVELSCAAGDLSNTAVTGVQISKQMVLLSAIVTMAAMFRRF